MIITQYPKVCFVLLLMCLMLMVIASCVKQEAVEPMTLSATESKVRPSISSSGQEWKEFSPRNRGFSVLLPGVPEETSRTLETDAGNLVTYNYKLTASATYEISCVESPSLMETPEIGEASLDDGRDHLLTGSQGRLISEQKIKVNGHPGRLMAVDLPDGSRLRAKTCLFGKRAYIAGVTCPKRMKETDEAKRLEESAASKFLDSFKLLSTP